MIGSVKKKKSVCVLSNPNAARTSLVSISSNFDSVSHISLLPGLGTSAKSGGRERERGRGGEGVRGKGGKEGGRQGGSAERVQECPGLRPFPFHRRSMNESRLEPLGAGAVGRSGAGLGGAERGRGKFTERGESRRDRATRGEARRLKNYVGAPHRGRGDQSQLVVSGPVCIHYTVQAFFIMKESRELLKHCTQTGMGKNRGF